VKRIYDLGFTIYDFFTMNKEEREMTNHLTALRGELEPMVNGHAVLA
jgi:hypothetical protein